MIAAASRGIKKRGTQPGKEGHHALARLLCSSLSHTGSNELQTALEGRTVTRGGGDGGRRRVDDDGAADSRMGGDGPPWPRSSPHRADPARGGPAAATEDGRHRAGPRQAAGRGCCCDGQLLPLPRQRLDGRRRCAGEGGQAATGRRWGVRIRDLQIRREQRQAATATNRGGAELRTRRHELMVATGGSTTDGWTTTADG